MALTGDFLFGEEGWLALRTEALTPLHVSELVTTERDRREFLRGATMLRFFGERAMTGRAPRPQQLVVVDALAAGRQRNACLLPRRSSKSTTLIAIGLGRAESREDYRVGILTLTTGKAGRSRFLKDVVPALERSAVPCKVIKSAGQERVEFPGSGGIVQWLSSIEDLRGEAFDLIILDEAGEADPQKVEDTLAAAMPTLDTRRDAQVVVAGTAGKYRTGNMLWEWLELGRAGRAGIVEYAMPDRVQDEDLSTWEAIEPLVLASHPGIGTLTTAEVIHERYETLPRLVFIAEYGGIFGDEGGTVSLFDALKWARTGVDGDPARVPLPERWSLSFAPHPDQLCVSIMAGWRDDEGRAVGMLLDRITGIDDAAPALLRLARKYKVPIVHDAGSQVAALIVSKLMQKNPRPRVEAYHFVDVKKAASLIVDEVDRENVVHWSRQLELNEAVHKAVKRKAGDRGWLVGRDPKKPDDDVTGVEAWALALLHYDSTKPKRRMKAVVAAA
ncbi:hypothetical protein [Microbacterium allomyrinae]|uniref:Terminase n=1 Tax=Microbacterium allomyrinae TaxID=2830666 RepID=A0A9X1S3P2_9MICO|nr:hypothetical protein [Microbacterium allomyrinae]MCC2032190.1 hypothetical protein [Microbacterium allomyrinae]